MSDFPRMMYHPDGSTAVAQSAHHERTEFAGWSREPGEKHTRDPGDGMVRTLQPVGPVPTAAPAPRHQDAPGPVSASDVRAIIRAEMADHPGLNLDFDEVASAADVEELHAKLDLLLKNLGVELPAGMTDAGPGDQPRKRRGRPAKNPENKLTGAAAGEQE